MGKTKIEWATDVWNPVAGCTKVSPGCDHCYAETISRRLSHNPKYALATKADGRWSGVVSCHEGMLAQPVRWKNPRIIFVCSMSDLFHDKVSWDFIVKVFNVMAATPWHTYQVLTKRPGRMAYFAQHLWPACITSAAPLWPVNVWAGTSVESQKYAPRLDCLLRIPAKVRFVSAEPLLGPLDLRPWLGCPHKDQEDGDIVCSECGDAREKSRWIHQVIVGGESGPGARPMALAWAKSLLDQCRVAGVACFMKQIGSEPMSGLGDQDVYEELIELAQRRRLATRPPGPQMVRCGEAVDEPPR